MLAAALVATPLVTGATLLVASAALPEAASILLALVAALGAVLLGPAEEGPTVAPRAALLLLAAGQLGRSFAGVLARRWPEPWRLVPAAVLLALFDLFSVLVGPARLAVEGGPLRALLLPLPVPGGATPGFVGVSDLVAIALLAGWLPAPVASRLRVGLASAAGLFGALGLAFATRAASPALPWILGAVALVSWPRLGVTRPVLVRTVRLAVLTSLALLLASVLLALVRRPTP